MRYLLARGVAAVLFVSFIVPAAASPKETAAEIRKKLQASMETFEGKAKMLRDAASERLNAFKGDVRNFFDNTADTLRDEVSKAIDWSRAAFDRMKKAVRAAGAALSSPDGALAKASRWVSDLADDIKEKAKKIVDKVTAKIMKPLTKEKDPHSGMRFMGMPVAQLATNVATGIGLGQIPEKLVAALKKISSESASKLKQILDPHDAEKTMKAVMNRIQNANEGVRAATKSAGAGLKSVLTQVTAGAVVGGTVVAGAIHAATFPTGYLSSFVSCLSMVHKWKQKVGAGEESLKARGLAWWTAEMRALNSDFAACYEKEFVDVFSRDFVWDGIYVLLVTPLLEVPILTPLSIHVGSLVTAAVSAVIGALTGGPGAALGPFIGGIAAIAVRVAITVALNAIIKKTPLRTKVYEEEAYPKLLRPAFVKAQGDAPKFFFNKVVVPFLLKWSNEASLVPKVVAGLAAAN